jgi:uncharacterized protein (TIGR00251 family)
MEALALTVNGGAVRFEVFAKPRASKSKIVGVREGALEVALAAPPVDGAANAELVKFLARVLGVSKSSVELVRGESSRTKLVAVHGLSQEELRARLAELR